VRSAVLPCQPNSPPACRPGAPGLVAGLSLLLLLALPCLSGAAHAEGAATGLAGRFLVAATGMPDLRFAETVIYMVRHDETGAMGLIINRPIGELALDELARGFDPGHDREYRAEDHPGSEPDGTAEREPGARTVLIHSGGPVQPQVGFVIHSDEVGAESSLATTGEVAVTSDPQILRTLSGKHPPRHWLFLLGYAGWGPGQLESELARHDWFTLPFDEALLFDADHGSKWQRAMELRGIEL